MKSFVSCFAIIFSINTVGESEAPSLLQREKRGSGKSYVLKKLFPDIGEITNQDVLTFGMTMSYSEIA